MKVVIFIMMCLLFMFPLPAFEGAKSGLLLWFHTVLPSLLPFIIISNLVVKLNITKQISVVLYPFFKKVFPITRHGCYPVLIGFLSGMPMGAKATSDLLEQGKISQKEATFLLTMCNNASPMFIISYIAINQLQLPQIKYVLVLMIYLSAILSALLYNGIDNLRNRNNASMSEWTEEYADTALTKISQERISTPTKFSIELLDDCIMNGFEIITKIGGYIILFSIFIEIFLSITKEASFLSLCFIGGCEITNGVCQIVSSSLSIESKIVLITAITAFGGLSGMAQTKSVLTSSRLSMSDYIKAKAIALLIALALSLIYVTYLLP